MSLLSKSRSVRTRAVVVCSAFALLFASATAALEVDRLELEKSGKERIVFINYEGPHARIDSAENIIDIGRELGRAVKNGATRAGDPKRYYAVHSVSAKTGGAALDADIIGLGVDAGVDHIRNLRLILRGFMQAAYDYSDKDSALLAEFATVYNAVHRGDWTYYTVNYKHDVVASLEKEKVGLSVRFDEWPGRAMIVIPLSEGAKTGSLSAVDTTPLTEKKVVDELRKKDDLGVESRKEMVDLKEREAAQAKQTAELQREAIVEEEKKIVEEKAALQAEKERLAVEREEVRKAEAETAVAETETKTVAESDKAVAAEKAIAEKEAAVAEKEQAIAEKETAIAEKKEEAAKTEEFAEKKEQEAIAERKEIAKDQQELIKKEDAATVQPKGELSLKMVSADGPYARFVLVEVSTGKELKTSALDTVRSRSIAEVGGRIVAVAGKTGGNGAVRLVIVDPVSLEMIKQGDDNVHPESPVWVNGENAYALSVVSGTIKLAAFDKDLKRKALSTAELHPFAALRFVSGSLLTQAADGSVLVLKDSDLTLVGR